MNNFDTSTAGVNLELSCYKDTMYSQDLWNNNFLPLGDSNSNLYQFIDYGNFKEKDIYSLDSYTDKTKESLKRLLLDKAYTNLDGAREASREMFDQSFSKLTRDQLEDLVNEEMQVQYDQGDRLELYSEYFTPEYEVIDIHGYDQGDYAEVVFFHEDMKQYNFTDQSKFIAEMKEYFLNLFYDAPYYCRLVVDGEDFEYNQYIQNEYKYDKEEILKITREEYIQHEKLEYILNWLDENLPEYPDYI